METIASRITMVVNALGKSKTDFARAINVTPAYISKLGKQPESMPSDRTISDICREFGVNEIWLREGVGEMFREKSISEELSAFFGDVMNDSPSAKSRLILALSRLTDDQWAVLETVIDDLANKKADPQ